jgi:hypothetical protein
MLIDTTLLVLSRKYCSAALVEGVH